MSDVLLLSQATEIKITDKQEELLHLLYHAPNREIPERKLRKKLVESLEKERLLYRKNGFVGLNGFGLSYCANNIADRHDLIPTVMLHWALDILEKHIEKDEEIGIGIDGKSRGWEGAVSCSRDIIAGYRKYIKKTWG